MLLTHRGAGAATLQRHICICEEVVLDVSQLSGAATAVLAGLLNGSFSVPLKLNRSWSWENSWLIYSLVGLLVIPFVVAVASVPHLSSAYLAAGPSAMALSAIFGTGWGVGSILFGLGMRSVGLSAAFAIVLGLTAACGTIVPLLLLSPELLVTKKGLSLLAGLVTVLVGISVCAAAGARKVTQSTTSSLNSPHRESLPERAASYRMGLLVCILSGLLSPMLNFALAFGAPIGDAAIRSGATAFGARSAVWALAVGCGSLVNIGYAVFLLTKNRTWNAFSGVSACLQWLGAIVMGVLWMAGILVYGVSVTKLGKAGAAIAWPLFTVAVIATASLWGFITGEWKSARSAAWKVNVFGLTILLLAIIEIGWGTSSGVVE